MNNKWKGKIASLCTERMQTAVLFACVMLGQIHWHCSGPTKKSVANLEFLSFPSCSGLAQSLREFKIPFIAYNQFLLLISSPLLATGQLKRVKRNEKQRGQIRKQKSKYFIMKGFFFFWTQPSLFQCCCLFTVDEKSGLVGLAKVTTSSS